MSTHRDEREFLLPDLGEGLTEAEIVRWLVEVGDEVAVDQAVVEVETAKAQVEVPCPFEGVVTARHGAEGEARPVGTPLIAVAVGGSAGGAAGRSSTGKPAGAPASSPAEDRYREAAGGSGNVLVGYGTGASKSAASGARRRRRALTAAGSAAGRGTTGPLDGHAPHGAVAPNPPTAFPADRAARPVVGGVTGASAAASIPSGAAADHEGTAHRAPVPVISPLVRRLARERGLDLRALHGSGPGGLILRADVDRAAAVRGGRTITADSGDSADSGGVPTTDGRAGQPAGVGADPTGAVRIPLRGITAAMADKLSRSRREIPDATCWVDADATELLAARRAMGEPTVSLLAVLARVTVAALARHPELNATVDTDAREIVRLPAVHLGFAAQTPRGLVVPVVRDAHTLSTEQLHREMSRLTACARDGRLTPADLTGSTFTLNNYGVFGVDGSTPIINHPEAAMLGVGRIVEKPWAHAGQLALRHVVQLSFTFDHRVCDGGVAGGFLRYVADCVERPTLLLRSL
ncbi:dihydrolipoamide acetyltransferase family protein [Streptomyces bohaiensis]|uniref:Dihydrolipoamide acetyltransferase component of pyruvate dehydrogenase complex n=1 Tax=Streptomyces bohaiensis TaxID=1431344 RepID=A0ABX1C8P7_9ACTN|nr:dihydrolipoamide acetyltransferase family protein [Streptomyces bohaiensis]NJQ15458.1 2-oxo acid dehydrogenase subunit E2 [Streptomyces bohaiensis]